jgi:hypothetical protein
MRRRGIAVPVVPVAAVAVAAVVLLAGCTDPAGAPAEPPAAAPVASASAAPHADSWDTAQMPDPCRTVSRAEVAAATKLSVSAGTTVDSWPPLCSFTVAGEEPEFLYVSVDPRPAAREDYDRQRSDSQATQDVGGIGDEAYWLPEFTALHIFDDGTHLTVKFAGSAPPPGAKAKALAVARAALT